MDKSECKESSKHCGVWGIGQNISQQKNDDIDVHRHLLCIMDITNHVAHF